MAYFMNLDRYGEEEYNGGLWEDVIVNPNATGNSPVGPRFLNNTTTGERWYIDALGVANLIEKSAFKNLREWHVDPNGSDTTGDGSQENPYATITKALTMAGQGDQVIVHAGVYTENITVSTPNVSIVGAQSDYGQLTQIDGSITVTATGTSVKIADLRATSVSHTGSAPLYLENVTLTSTLTSSSTGYLEIRNSTIQDGTITKSAGSMTIEQSKIDNVSITGTNTAGIIRNSYQDGGSTVTYGAGTIYGIYNLQGGDLSVNATAIPIETAALAQGLSAELAKEAETSDFMKLGMIRPDTEASPTKVVTWDELTGRLEVSDLSAINTGAPVTVGTNTPTGVSIEGAIHLVTDDGTPTGTVLEQYIYDVDSGVWIEMNRNAKSMLKFGTSSPTNGGDWDGEEYIVTSDGTSTGTVLEQWVYDYQTGEWVQRPTSSPELVHFGTTAPTSTTGYTAGDEFFVTSDGTSTGTITAQYIFNGTTWTLRPTPVASLTTTSISPKVYQSGSFANAQANASANVADLLQLSDGSRIHTGEVTWTGHGLTVGAWYYLDQSAPGGYTTTRPTSGLVQQLFFVEDANTIHVDIEEAWTNGGSTTQDFANTVYFNFTDPNSASATIFDLANPPTTNNNTLKADPSNIYIGTNGSMWTYNSSTGTYSTYTIPTTTPVSLTANVPAATSVPSNTSTFVTGFTSTQGNSYPTSWNGTTGTFTAPRAGYYHVDAAIEWGAPSTNTAGVIYVTQIVKNDTTAVAASRQVIQASYSGVFLGGPCSGNVYLAAGDTIRLKGLHTGAAARSINGTAYSYLNVHEII